MVRVRFAPSPTGEPHVGSAWTALFNWLFAKSKGGLFILRIEDTDQARTIPGTVEKIYEMLDWLSLKPDEGPREGGKFGPYVQSERLPRYREAVDQLLKTGAAYRCFCTPERLVQLRSDQQGRGLPPMYDRLCRSITAEESLRRSDSEPFVVRLAIPDGTTEAHDMVRSTVKWDNATLDDSVLLKSDGFPTYHLANVVDDHAMEITHVIRAEEWLPSLPKHLILYAAFGWKPPTFAHLPLILGSDRKKLSKRHGHVAALEYRRDFLAEAFTNFLILMGWRLRSDADRELFSLDELKKLFDLEGVRPSGAIFDSVKLNWLNREWMRREPERTRDAVASHLPAIQASKISDDLLHLATEHSTTLSAVGEQINSIINPPALPTKLLIPTGSTSQQSKAALTAAHGRLESIGSWNAPTIDSALHGVGESLGEPPSVVQWPIRIALAHQNPSPSGAQLAVALGKEETLQRLTEALEAL